MHWLAPCPVYHYNPVIARFTQEDTYRGDGLNLYAYCWNNPVCYVDPSGHWCGNKEQIYQGLLEREGLTAEQAAQNPDLQMRLMAEAANIAKGRDSGTGENIRLRDLSKGGSSSLDNIISIMKDGKLTPDGRNIITQLDDDTKVIFRMDVGANAHSMEMYGYNNPVDHINIEIQVKATSGKYKTKWNFHIILDQFNEVANTFATGVWNKR